MISFRSICKQFGLAVALCVFGVGDASAVIVLSENFETPAVNTNVTTANSIFNTTVNNSGTAVVLQATDEATQGITFTGSQFLRYVDGTGVPNMRSRFTLAPLNQSAITGTFQLSWDYYEPNAVVSGTATHFRVLLSQGDVGVNANRAVDLNLTALNDGLATSGSATNWNGTSISFPTNKLVHFTLVGNVGADTTYYGGDLPTQTYDLYRNGFLAGNNFLFRAPNDVGGIGTITAINEFGIGYPSGSGSTRFQRAFADNFVLSNEIIPIPEASSILVIGLGGVFALGAVWFGKRASVSFLK